jgi:hypothetical protein
VDQRYEVIPVGYEFIAAAFMAVNNGHHLTTLQPMFSTASMALNRSAPCNHVVHYGHAHARLQETLDLLFSAVLLGRIAHQECRYGFLSCGL